MRSRDVRATTAGLFFIAATVTSLIATIPDVSGLTHRRMHVRFSVPEIAAFAPQLLDGYRSPSDRPRGVKRWVANALTSVSQTLLNADRAAELDAKAVPVMARAARLARRSWHQSPPARRASVPTCATTSAPQRPCSASTLTWHEAAATHLTPAR